MRAIYDLSASAVPVRELAIGASTAVRAGQLLAVTDGLAVLSAANRTTAIAGIALENHSGTADPADPRAAGKRIRAAAGPHTVFAAEAPYFTVTSGTATTAAATGLSAYSDDNLNGWTVMLRSKAANSTNTDPVGTVYSVTDFAASGKVLTLSGLGGAPAAGDTFWVFPSCGPLKALLNTGRDGLTVTGGTPVSLPLQVVGCDYDRREIHLTATLHEFGNKRA